MVSPVSLPPDPHAHTNACVYRALWGLEDGLKVDSTHPCSLAAHHSSYGCTSDCVEKGLQKGHAQVCTGGRA